MKKWIFALILLPILVVGAQKIDNIVIDGNTILSANTNGDIVLDPNGTGGVQFNDLTATTVPYLDANKEITSSSVTPTELGYLSGVTSAIQTQLDGKLASGGFTASRALETDGTGDIQASTVTSTELSYLSGVTSSIQTQIDGTIATSDLLDEDNMASDSNTQPATQQSIKAYVDAHTGASSSVHGVTGSVVGTGGVQILSTKTLDTPAISSGAVFINNAYLRLRESGGVDYIGLVAPASVTTSVEYILPEDGTSGEFLKTNGSGTLSWDTPSPAVADLSVSSISTTTTASTSVDVYLCNTSSAAFTVTLPTAVGNSGEVFVFKYTDTGFANALTIDGATTETIDGSLTTTLNTQGETLKIVSDGSNWEIIERKIPKRFVSYTPGLDSTTNVSSREASWTRDGEYIYIEGTITWSGNGAGNLVISIPSGLTIDTTKLYSSASITNNRRGSWNLFGTGSTGGYIAYNSTTTVRGITNAGAYLTGSARVSGDDVLFNFYLPVSGWNP